MFSFKIQNATCCSIFASCVQCETNDTDPSPSLGADLTPTALHCRQKILLFNTKGAARGKPLSVSSSNSYTCAHIDVCTGGSHSICIQIHLENSKTFRNCRSLFCLSAHLIRNLPNSKNFHLVLLFELRGKDLLWFCGFRNMARESCTTTTTTHTATRDLQKRLGQRSLLHCTFTDEFKRIHEVVVTDDGECSEDVDADEDRNEHSTGTKLGQREQAPRKLVHTTRGAVLDFSFYL